MPDMNIQPAPVSVETGDGWLVISKALRTGSVVPPYQYQYSHEHYRTLEDAEAAYADLEAGEWRGWSPVSIVACKDGVPLGSKAVL